jgi:2',3'-cyclic-nucleotide 2'-phosphodiesterase / 3'-nucleotidase / 5'-nucleotidase
MPKRSFPIVLACLLGCAPAGRARDASTVDLVVVATTDIHGRLRGWDYYTNAPDGARGLTRAATIVDSVRVAHPGRVLLVDAGDLLQGNPLTYVAARVSPDSANAVVAAMNVMGYDAAVVGNHEFNYGLPYLARAIGQARFPFLAANAYTADGRRAYAGWRVVSRGDVRVGIVGATTPGAMVWDRDNLAGRLQLRDIVPEVRTAVGEARRGGAQVVLVVVHSGLNEPASYDTVGTGLPSENVSARIAREVDGVDLVVYGHSHREMRDTVIGNTMLVQPKNWAGSVAVVHLGLTREGGGWRVATRRGELVAAAGHAESPRVLATTEAIHRQTVAYVMSPVGSTPVAWRADSARVADTPLIDFILETERRAAGADLASTAAFSLAATLDSGPITIAELAGLYPYDNTLRAVRISGRQLREYLEYSARYFRTLPPEGARDTASMIDPAVPGFNFDIVAGAEYVLDLTRPIGGRVTRLTVKGRLVADTDSYSLALNNYRQTGGGGYTMLRGAPVVYDRQQEVRQLLIDEVRRRGTIRPEDYFTRNWSIEPPAAVAAAYAALRRQPAFDAAPAVAPQRGRHVALWRGGPRRLRIVATNDFHGALEPRVDSAGVRRGGAAALATVVRRALAECAPPACAALLVDGGDMFQGTLASNLAFGRPVVALFDTLGYAAAALGNHEFDWGIDSLRARMRDAHYAILGANVRYADGRDVEWVPNDTVVERGGLRIGIIGIATVETPSATRAGNTTGLRFDAPAPIVDSITRALRARGVDAVIVLSHAGAFCDRSGTADCHGEVIELARNLTEPVDAIVSGHTHTLVDTDVRDIPIVQARVSGRAVGIVDLPLDSTRDGDASRPQVRDVLSDSVPADPVAAGIVREALAQVSGVVGRKVATIAQRMSRSGNQYALGNLVADAQRWKTGADVAVMNNGGIRADLPAGVATYGTLYEVQPFGNTLHRLRVRGSALRQYLERLVGGERIGTHVSGLRLTYDPARNPGGRITSLVLDDGKPLRDDATYTVVMNDFMATGGDGLGLAGDSLAESLRVDDLGALIDYLRQLPQPVRAPERSRITRVAP